MVDYILSLDTEASREAMGLHDIDFIISLNRPELLERYGYKPVEKSAFARSLQVPTSFQIAVDERRYAKQQTECYTVASNQALHHKNSSQFHVHIETKVATCPIP